MPSFLLAIHFLATYMQKVKHIKILVLQVSTVSFIYQDCLALGNRIYSRKFQVTCDLGFMDWRGNFFFSWKTEMSEDERNRTSPPERHVGMNNWQKGYKSVGDFVLDWFE